MSRYPPGQGGGSRHGQGSSGYSSMPYKSTYTSYSSNPFKSTYPSGHKPGPEIKAKDKGKGKAQVPAKPKVMAITVSGRLGVDKLEDRIEIINKKYSDEDVSREDLMRPEKRPDAVIVTVSQIYNPQLQPGRRLTEFLVEYVNFGGTLILCRTAANLWSDYIDNWFHFRWGLPWRRGALRKTAVKRSERGLGPKSAGQLQDLPRYWYSEFQCLKGVDYSQDQWYRITSVAMYTDQRGDKRPVPQEERNQTAVAFVPVGEGFLGWVGDKEKAPEQEMIIAAMLNLDITTWYDSDCSGSL